MDFPHKYIPEEKIEIQPNEKQKEKKAVSPFAFGLFLLAILAAAGFYFFRFYLNPASSLEKEPAKNIDQNLSQEISKFAAYEELPIIINPQVPDYSVQNNFNNVINKDDFIFSVEAEALLKKNNFVVIPAEYREFYSLYEQSRYQQIPNFVTTDSMLHNYHLLFDYALKKTEQEKLIPELENLNEIMLAEALSQYELLKDTEWESVAKRNVGFFSVGSRLLEKNITIPEFVKKQVEQELALIEDHQGIEISPIMGIKEDYSQYVPRGHYDQSQSLKNYFKTMMWYGRLTFVFKDLEAIKSAVLVVAALDKNNNLQSWDKIYEPINFFVGKTDDINYYEFKKAITEIYGQEINLSDIDSDENKFLELVALAQKMDPPQINSMPIFNSEIEPNREEVIKGFRFLGQRFTIDASIFQRLIDREVPDRMLPKSLDIPAALGSAEALNILTEMKEGEKYPAYLGNMSKIQSHLLQLPKSAWTQNLYWGWLNALKPLLEEKSNGYPSFMQNQAWIRKDLNTFLGSWTELKHDTVLYAKQAYAEMGGGPLEKDSQGYVEPNVYVYSRLASLLRMTIVGLETRGLMPAGLKENLEIMEKLALSLKTISEKELNNQSLTQEEYDLIDSYGGQLEEFWIKTSEGNLNVDSTPVVTDVATDPNGFVLEQGVGFVSEIYVVVPINGKLKITKGGVYSYYEFPWPLSDRLTDKQWAEMCEKKEPKAPDWTKAFISNAFAEKED